MKSTVSYMPNDMIKVGMPDYYMRKIAELIWIEYWGDNLASCKAYADLCRITKDEGANLLSLDLSGRVENYPQMEDWNRFIDAVIDNGKQTA